MGSSYDVIVVGGGIAGASAACALARAGVSVLVLEREARYTDHVRGEGMSPWGVTEAARLGVDDVMVGAGGSYVTNVAAYDEAWDPSDVVPTDLSQFGLRGFLHVGHPDACAALNAAAAAAGAKIIAGATVHQLSAGSRPSVTYSAPGHDAEEADCRVIVGADGRNSFVRRTLRFPLNESEAITFGAGLLVTNDSWPETELALGTGGAFHFIIAPRPGATRLYLFSTPEVARSTLSGGKKSSSFLAAFPSSTLPAADAFATAEPAGPCAVFPMTDSWVDSPTAEGVVLVGDAAGWSNPIVGQGLSIALRDVRQVTEAMTSATEITPHIFEPYVAERRERMRRLRALAFVDTCILSRFDDVGRSVRLQWRDRVNSDQTAAAHMLGKAVGVDDFPAEIYEPGAISALVGSDHPYVHALASQGLEPTTGTTA